MIFQVTAAVLLQLPVLAALKIQCCPVPTSVLSNHTGFPVYFFDDYTDKMEPYVEKWKELGLSFDGIVSGFLGSERQIQIVKNMITEFKGPETKVIVDPIMGDHGEAYATYTEAMCRKMKELAEMADVLTPNLTEACILTGREYNAEYGNEELEIIAKQLSDMGPSKIVITGIVRGTYIANYCYEDGCGGYEIKTTKVGTQRSGTGDIFTAIIAADAVNKVNFHESVRKASQFIKKCIMKSIELEIPVTDGVCFEELLTTLR
mgnify:CR=1 FL=1